MKNCKAQNLLIASFKLRNRNLMLLVNTSHLWHKKCLKSRKCSLLNKRKRTNIIKPNYHNFQIKSHHHQSQWGILSLHLRILQLTIISSTISTVKIIQVKNKKTTISRQMMKAFNTINQLQVVLQMEQLIVKCK